jgi:hypothetical protein
MKVWDEYGRLLVAPSPSSIIFSEILGTTFAIYNNKWYLHNQTDGLYYEVLCDTDQGVVNMFLADTGITIP